MQKKRGLAQREVEGRLVSDKIAGELRVVLSNSKENGKGSKYRMAAVKGGFQMAVGLL